MDITDIESALQQEDPLIEKDSYDVVIDKGCLDCIACHEDMEKMQHAVRNVNDILMPGGFYFLVSRGSPDMRMHLFEKEGDEPEPSEVNSDEDNKPGEPQSFSNVDESKWF